jgi:putative oxidoreductase
MTMAAPPQLSVFRRRLQDKLQGLSFLGPTLARLTVGVVFFRSGWGKIHDLERVTDFFNELHIPAAAFQARLVACTELAGGLAMLLGLATRFASMPLAITMVVAIATAKRGEIEGPGDLFGLGEWSYLVFFVWIALVGAGPLSLDHVIARRLGRRHDRARAA